MPATTARKFRKARPGRRRRMMRYARSSGVARAFKTANLQRHISKTFQLNGENQQAFFYNILYANESFALGNLPGAEVAAIQELYDYYRIDGIKLEFYPQWNSASGVNAQPEIGLARLTHAIDTNIGFPPGTEGDLLQYRNAKSPLFNRVIKKYFKVQPQQQVLAPNPAIAVQPDNKRNLWIETREPNVPHYGIHFIASTLSGVPNETSYRILVTYYMTFKGQR